MKLYYAPGTCALAPHIVANEVDLPIELVKVDLASKKTEAGDDYLAINPHGYVPALLDDGGHILTEASVIVQYLGDLKPDSGMMPPAGTFARYKVQQLLAFIATELHQTFGSFFKTGTPEEAKAASRALLEERVGQLNEDLRGKTFLTGETFTAADAYLWTVLSWSDEIDFDLTPFSEVRRFLVEVTRRPAVQKSLAEQDWHRSGCIVTAICCRPAGVGHSAPPSRRQRIISHLASLNSARVKRPSSF